ncbi:hypothetical protein [Nocardioides deserti]|uniref:PH domain-containing protein n=1 Tax=Nocardioides deserti TaxID=1588644 RepID=A0ABR6U9F0_9ACTN|nr:hypothetical protein [Nocardioides deserti]MBC2961003.1 hypothetical protein [Nocardioides deserti]GGO76075.1 hypothetical protein GCM10012276_27970 [Nocardioides deserti]
MVDAAPDEVTERYRPTNGLAIGILTLVAAVGTLVLGIVDDFPAPVVAGAFLVGVLAWAALLKPRVKVADRRLVLVNMLETVSIPLAAVEEVVVRQVLAVRVGEKRYVSPAIGHTLRATLASTRPPKRDPRRGDVLATPQAPSYPDVVENRIDQLVTEDRKRLGVGRGSPEVAALGAEVRRTPAWVEIGLLAVGVVALVATIVV